LRSFWVLLLEWFCFHIDITQYRWGLDMSELLTIPVQEILPNPDQPRTDFHPAEIENLAQSIEEHGLIQPIVVEQNNGYYILIDGERRLRAVKSLGLAWIKAVVHTYDEQPADKLIWAIIANMQRSDLNPIEEGEAFEKLHQQGMTISTIARTVGRSISHVNTRLKMLEFEPEIRELYARGELPIDIQLISDLLKIPDERRVPLATKYATNGTSSAKIKQSLVLILRDQDRPDVPLSRKRRSPAAILSNMPVVSQILKSLDENGSLPQWKLIEQAADETCKNCVLYDTASSQTCGGCPAIELITRLNRLSEAEDRK
jgi:ParB/RepB/Spo0J family partition protein